VGEQSLRGAGPPPTEHPQNFAYLDGDHKLTYATDEWSKFHKDRYHGFSDNWCGIVAQSPVDRLRIDGFRLGDSTEVATSDEKQLWADWQRNEMAAQASQGFLSSTVAKRSATLVWGDENDDPRSPGSAPTRWSWPTSRTAGTGSRR
jgi:hypothetical protein